MGFSFICSKKKKMKGMVIIMNKSNVMRFFRGIQRVVSKHSPEILTGIGIAGMVTTTVLAVKATPKAMQLVAKETDRRNYELLKEARDNNQENCQQVTKLTPFETVKVTWKCYIPVATTGVFSIACLIGAQSVNARRTAALATAYKLSETALAEFKEAAVDVIGEEKVKEVKQKISEKKVEEVTSDESKTKVIITGDGDTWFVDPFSNTRFQSSKNKIDAAANKLNRDMRDEMHISLSQFYDELGLDHTLISDRIGWNITNGYIDVDYSDAVVRDGKAYILLDFIVRPEYDFDQNY